MLEISYMPLLENEDDENDPNFGNDSENDDLTNPQWGSKVSNPLLEYFSGLDYSKLDLRTLDLDFNTKNSKSLFINLCALVLNILFESLYKQDSEKNPELVSRDSYIFEETFNRLTERVRFILVQQLVSSNGEKAKILKLYLHVLYEIVYFSKRIIEDFDPDKDKDQYIFRTMEKLISRTSNLDIAQKNFQALNLIYLIRGCLFGLINREYEYAYWINKRTKLYIACNLKDKETYDLLNHCKDLSEFIPTFELDKAMFLVQSQSYDAAISLLKENYEFIDENNKKICKNPGVYPGIKDKDLIHKVSLYTLEIMIKQDPTNTKIREEFNTFIARNPNLKDEKFYYVYANYLDNYVTNMEKESTGSGKKKVIEETFNLALKYYLKSIKMGDKYLWHTLPRTLEIWFEHQDKLRRQGMRVEKQLLELENYKIAQVLKILLSRFGLAKCHDTIVELVSRIAAEYPLQSSWWIYHFKYFHYGTNVQSNMKLRSDEGRRQKFVTSILDRVKELGPKHCRDLNVIPDSAGPTERSAEEKFVRIFEDTELFIKLLIKFAYSKSEKRISKVKVPHELKEFNFKRHPILMPIQDNLRPNMPGPDDDPKDFSYYKANPVYITGIENMCKIMQSKEQPKKLTFYGSDGKTYNFLLKCDNEGDLRKEARFIDYANMLNIIFDSDPDTKSRNVNLHTYSIIPLSRNTGLIEWLDNTRTFKNVITEEWNKFQVKADFQYVVGKAKRGGKGNTHKEIWDEVQNEMSKDVMWDYFSTRFPTPNLMTEARIRFMQSYSAWCMAGYIVGLGDRH